MSQIDDHLKSMLEQTIEESRSISQAANASVLKLVEKQRRQLGIPIDNEDEDDEEGETETETGNDG